MTKPHELPICGKLAELAQFNRERGWENGRYATEAAAVIESLVEALETIAAGSKLGTETFEQRVNRSKGKRLTWYAVNVLQDNLAACIGTAENAIEKARS